MTYRRLKHFIPTTTVFILILVTALPGLCTDPVTDDGQEGAVADVNGKEIIRSTYERQVNVSHQQLMRQGIFLDEDQLIVLRSQVLEGLIDDELLFQESRKSGYKPERKEVKEQIEQIKKQFSSEEEYLEALAQMDYTEDSLKDEIGRNMAIKRFIETEIVQKSTVPEEEAVVYYNDHPEQFTQPEQVRASHILLMAESEDQAVRARLMEIQQKLKDGSDFETMAKEYSEGPSGPKGGDLGFFERGRMVKPFEDAAFSLKPGEVSSIVQTKYGYHLIKVTDKRPSLLMPYETMEEKILDFLKQEKTKELLKSIIDKARSTASIERFTVAAPSKK